MKSAPEADSLNRLNTTLPKTYRVRLDRDASYSIKKKRWFTLGMLALTMLTYLSFCEPVSAAEVGEDAGVEKETMLSLIQKGGKIMYPLALGSILALALGLERFISLRKQRILPDGFLDGLLQAWNSDPTGQRAIRYCDESGGTSGHIFKAGIRRARSGPEVVERTIEDVGSREADRMKRSLRPLSVIATISPLLGLLGTVYGMIDAFQKTSASGGTAKTSMLATGIYEALVTTAAGLTIAIPVLLLYQFLLGRVDGMIDAIDETATEFVLGFSESQPRQAVAQQPIQKPLVAGDEPPAPPSKPAKRSRPEPPPPPPRATTKAGT